MAGEGVEVGEAIEGAKAALNCAEIFMPPIFDEDGLPIDEVGPWVKEKHERLRKYIDITSATRRKWIQGPGGATYIDLFCGTGRAIIRDTNEKVDGSPLGTAKCHFLKSILPMHLLRVVMPLKVDFMQLALHQMLLSAMPNKLPAWLSGV